MREQVRSAENTRRHQLQPFPPSFIAFYSRSTPGLCSWDPSPGSLCQLAPLACGLEWLRLEYYEQQQRAWQVGSAAGPGRSLSKVSHWGPSHRHPTPCVWMRHQAPPSLARAGLLLGQNTQFLTARSSVSLSPQLD